MGASAGKRGLRKRVERAKATEELSAAVVKVMANALRTQILTTLCERVASASELAKELGRSIDSVSYEMRVLREAKLIEKVAEKRVRGADETFYRATTRASFDDAEWMMVADNVKLSLRSSLLQTLMDDAIDALTEGVFDARDDAHMSWVALIADEQGCEDIARILGRALSEVLKVRDDSAERLIAKDEEGISLGVSMLGYTTASETRKVGPPPDAKPVVTSTERRKTRES